MKHDAASLSRAGRDLKPPFTLRLDTGAGEAAELRITQLLRLLPGKRFAALGSWRGKQVFVKVFFGKRAMRPWQRELQGIAAIQAAGVPTPAPLWQGELPPGGKLLLTAYLEGGQSLAESGHPADARQQDAVMESLARLHSAGVQQRDIHLDNFIVCKGTGGKGKGGQRLFLVDGGQVTRRRQGPLGKRACIPNLALYFAQFPQALPLDLPAALASYCRHRGWPPAALPAKQLLPQLAKQRQARKRVYLGKAFRNCTRFAVESSARRFTVCERQHWTPAMRRLLASPDAAIASGRLLKRGNTSTVAAVPSPIGQLAIKRYNIKGLAHRLSRLLRPSRAWHSWRNALLLEFTGIRTPAPIAMIEERLGPLRGRAYYISRLEAAPDATQLPALQGKAQETAIAELAALLRLLDQAALSHGDLKATNLILTPQGPALIDLDALRDHQCPRLAKRAQARDLRRFLRNWQPQLQAAFAQHLA